MRLMFLGDVMGRSGRAAITAQLPRLRKEWRIDFVVRQRRERHVGRRAFGGPCAHAAGGGRRCHHAGRSRLRPARHAAVHRHRAAHPAPAQLRQGRAGAGGAGLFEDGRGRKALRHAGAGAGFHEAALRRSVLCPRRGAEGLTRAAGWRRRSWSTSIAEATSEKMATGHFLRRPREPLSLAPTPMCPRPTR